MRTQSQQSQVAKLCKKYCKSINVKCKAKSESFSMGDSVNVTVYDQSPEVMKQLRVEFSQYQYGHFDGMQDMYESSNRRDDIPQTKFLTVSNEFSEDLLQSAWTWVRSYFESASDYPAGYRELSYSHQVMGNPAQETVYRLLRGALTNTSDLYWASVSK